MACIFWQETECKLGLKECQGCEQYIGDSDEKT